MSDTEKLISQLEKDGFYGSLEVKFEAGKVVLIRKTESIKPNYRNNRGNDNESD